MTVAPAKPVVGARRARSSSRSPPSTSSAGRWRPSSRSRWSIARSCGSSPTGCRRSATFFYSQTRTGAFATEATNTFRYAPATVPVAQAIVEEAERAAAMTANAADRAGIRQQAEVQVLLAYSSPMHRRVPPAAPASGMMPGGFQPAAQRRLADASGLVGAEQWQAGGGRDCFRDGAAGLQKDEPAGRFRKGRRRQRNRIRQLGLSFTCGDPLRDLRDRARLLGPSPTSGSSRRPTGTPAS